MVTASRARLAGTHGLPTWALLACMLPSAALATESHDLAAMSLEEILQLEVAIASRTETTWMDTPAAVFVITADDIRRSGATTVPGALRMVPGMHVARLSSRRWAVSARGFADTYADKLLVLVDGRSVYTPLYSGVAWETLDVQMMDIQRIEVTRGPGASVWGANAVNGVVNIITRSAEQQQGTLVHADTGNEVDVIEARHGFPVGKGHLAVFGREAAFDAQEIGPTGEGDLDWNSRILGVTGEWTPGRSGRDSVGIIVRHRESGGAHLARPFSLDPATTPVERGEWTSRGWSLTANWTRQLEGGGRLQVSANGQTEHDRDGGYASDRQALAASVVHALRPMGRHAITWGADHSRHYLRLHDGDFLRFQEPDYDGHAMEIFIQDEIRLAPKTRLTLGTKLHSDETTDLGWQPSVRVLWEPTERVSIWGAASRALRTPNVAERIGDFYLGVTKDPSGLPIALRILGQPDTHPAAVIALETGVRWQAGTRFSMDVAAFVNDYSHMRTLEPLAPVVRTTPALHVEQPLAFSHLSEARTRGLEVLTTWQPCRRWRMTASHAMIDVNWRLLPESRDPLGNAYYERGNTPRHATMLRSSLELPRGFALDVTGRKAWGWIARGASSGTVVDARVSWRHDGLELFAAVHDAFAADRREHSGQAPFVGVGSTQRSVHAGVTWRF